MTFFFSRQQKELLSVLCFNHGTDGNIIRQKLINYSHVSLRGDEFEVVENAVNDILCRIKDVSDETFGEYLEQELGGNR